MPYIAEETIQRVAEANDIVEVIGSYFPLKRAGSTFKALCPFHSERSPSFTVNPQRQMFKCFGCGAGGSVFRFLMDYEHLDFASAVRRLAQRANIPVLEEAGGMEDGENRRNLRRRLLALHVEAATWFHHHLLKSPSGQNARDYLKSRGFTSAIASAWQLGYAPNSWEDLPNFLHDKKFTSEEIIESGLVVSKESEDSENRKSKIENSYARFRDRIIFPIRNDFGEVIAFSGRVLDPEARGAKYVNSPETPLFTKGRVLYGLDQSKRALIEAKTAIVCEGQLDLIRAFEAGVKNVIAPQGTAFTPDQGRVLRRFVETVILCFDSDQAGQKAVTRSLPALLGQGLEVRVARLPEGEDPDSLIRTRGADAFREVVDTAKNFFDHALDLLAARGRLADPTGKSAAAKRLGPHVALITDPVLRQATADQICARLGITAAAFAPHLRPPSHHPHESETPTRTPAAERLEMSEGIRQLCRLAILHPETRTWLAEQDAPPAAELGPGGVLLARILESSLPLHEAPSRIAFASGLPPEQEEAITNLDLERAPETPLSIAQNLWFGLAAGTLRETRDAAVLQLRQPGISPAERQRIQHLATSYSKMILDFQARITEL